MAPERHPPRANQTRRLRFALALPVLLTAACATVIDSATTRFGDALSSGILNQSDVAIVRDGLPAYLLLVDGFIAEAPDSSDLLLAGAELYGAYAGSFVDQPERARALARRGRSYGQRALCIQVPSLCAALELNHAQWVDALAGVQAPDLEALYGFAASWATWIQVSTGDWEAIADVPKVEAAMERVVALAPEYEDGWPFVYLGVLDTQLPPAYGGKPEEGRAHFERAIELSGGRNLMAQVLFAERYARLVFDRALHDRLLEAALAAPVEADALTLVNVLAQRRARQLLAGSDDYF